MSFQNDEIPASIEDMQLKEALWQSEERFRRVITSISDHIYSSEITENGDRANLYISPNVEDLTGYPLENFVRDWSFWPKKVIHPDDQAAAAKQAALLANGHNAEMEYRLTKANGEIIWVRDSGRAEYTGTSMLVYGVVSNITKRKKAEEALVNERAMLAERVKERTAELSQVNTELAHAARLKDEFLAAMSHELRTPLNVVLGMSESLQAQVYGPLTNRQRGALQRIEESGRHLLSLINDILDLSKIEAGKLTLQIASVNVNNLCQSSLYFVQQNADDKWMKFSLNIEPDITLYADERRLKQALINLLNNAVKFTPKKGEFGLRVTQDLNRQSVSFTVWDTGIGIAEEDMGRLFKPFVQLDARLSRQYEGTGLGLALVFRIAEMHQGSVSVESNVGQGSQFTITVPSFPELIDGTLIQSGENFDRLVDTAPLILLVEDNEANLVTIASYLQAKSYRVSVARDGAEALERVHKDQPDLILMDIQIPVINGLEVTHRIKADDNLKNVPIIALTALAMPGDKEQCLNAGVDKYISKPVSLRRLKEEIELFLL